MDEKKTHYLCPGECNGVSDTLGVCQDKSCSNYGKPLIKCEGENCGHIHENSDALENRDI